MKVILKQPCLFSVTVSVLSIEGTDCRLDELGRLADRTGGKVRSGMICYIQLVIMNTQPQFWKGWNVMQKPKLKTEFAHFKLIFNSQCKIMVNARSQAGFRTISWIGLRLLVLRTWRLCVPKLLKFLFFLTSNHVFWVLTQKTATFLNGVHTTSLSDRNTSTNHCLKT